MTRIADDSDVAMRGFSIATRRHAVEKFILDGIKTPKDFKVGIELEAICLKLSGARAPYSGGRHSVAAALETFHKAMGGSRILENGRLIGLESRHGNLTLEPGSQLEWSSPPVPTAAELHGLIEDWLKLRDAVLHEHELRASPRAYTPRFVEERHLSPKRRYREMRSRYASRLYHARAAMNRTAGVHLSFDFESERDWRHKFRAMLMLTPVAIAEFANSPGAWKGQRFAALRPWLWRELDSERTQLPPNAFRNSFGPEDYSRWVVSQTPLVRSRYADDTDKPAEYAATQLGSAFPLVRSKQVLEVRVNDLVGAELLRPAVEFWTLLLYDRVALSNVLKLTAWIKDRETWNRLFYEACRCGVAVRGRLTRLICDVQHELAEAAVRSPHLIDPVAANEP